MGQREHALGAPETQTAHPGDPRNEDHPDRGAQTQAAGTGHILPRFLSVALPRSLFFFVFSLFLSLPFSLFLSLPFYLYLSLSVMKIIPIEAHRFKLQVLDTLSLASSLCFLSLSLSFSLSLYVFSPAPLSLLPSLFFFSLGLSDFIYSSSPLCNSSLITILIFDVVLYPRR